MKPESITNWQLKMGHFWWNFSLSNNYFKLTEIVCPIRPVNIFKRYSNSHVMNSINSPILSKTSINIIHLSWPITTTFVFMTLLMTGWLRPYLFLYCSITNSNRSVVVRPRSVYIVTVAQLYFFAWGSNKRKTCVWRRSMCSCASVLVC